MAEEKTPYPSDAADKFLLRLPEGMREKLKLAAKNANRTMNSEIVARLQDSFDSSRDDAKLVMHLESGRLTARADAIGVRGELLTAKRQMLQMNLSLLSLEIERDTKAAQSDADFAAVEKKIQQLDSIELGAKALATQAEELIKDRDEHIVEMDRFLAALDSRRSKIEEAMAEYQRKKQARVDGKADAPDAAAPPASQADPKRHAVLTDEAVADLRASEEALPDLGAENLEAAGRKRRSSIRVSLKPTDTRD